MIVLIIFTNNNSKTVITSKFMLNFDVITKYNYLIFNKRKSISNVRKNLNCKDYNRFQY